MLSATQVRQAIHDICINGNNITLTTYGELAKHLDIPPVDRVWSSHPLCPIFGILDRQDHDNGRPMLTALVANADTGIPGPGFFKEYFSLQGFENITLGENESRIEHSKIVAKLRSYYKKNA